MLPNDPYMLLSFLNMKLRDNYDSLAALCDDYGVLEDDLKARLAAIGYVYDENKNAFCG